MAADGLSLAANGFDVALERLRTWDADSSGKYVDLHAWRFTPSSFELILLELARLKYMDWRVERITAVRGCEFHAILRRGAIGDVARMTSPEFDRRRLELLKTTLQEQGEQVRFAE